jgi:hypothetical protein
MKDYHALIEKLAEMDRCHCGPEMEEAYTVYPETAKFAADIILKLKKDPGFAKKADPQNEEEAIYRKYICAEKINNLRKRFPIQL